MNDLFLDLTNIHYFSQPWRWWRFEKRRPDIMKTKTTSARVADISGVEDHFRDNDKCWVCLSNSAAILVVGTRDDILTQMRVRRAHEQTIRDR